MKQYYPSYLSVLKYFMPLIIYSLYFLIHSNLHTFEFYLWLFFLLITMLILSIQLFRIKNRIVKPIISFEDGYIITDTYNIKFRLLDEKLVSEIIIKKKFIKFKLYEGETILIEVSALSSQDRTSLFDYIKTIYTKKIDNAGDSSDST